MRRGTIFLAFLVTLALTTSVALAGHQPSTSSPIKDYIMFYVVAGNPAFIGPAAPSNVARTPNDLLKYALRSASDKEAFVFQSFTLEGEEGSFLTTLLVFEKDGAGFKGWNLVINRGGKGKTERKYISATNGERAELIIDEAMYIVLARIDLEATNKKLAPESLDQKLKPYLDYLNGLL